MSWQPDLFRKMKRYVYIEDNQGYYTVPFIFETDCPDSVTVMQELSWKPLGAGRLSTSFLTFADILRTRGHIVRFIEKMEKNSEPCPRLEVIKGATGNY